MAGKVKLGGPEISQLFVSNRTAPWGRELRHAEMGATRDMAEHQRVVAAFNADADACHGQMRMLFAHSTP